MDLTAAFAALLVLKPMLARHHRLNAGSRKPHGSGACERLRKGPSSRLRAAPSAPAKAGAFF